MKPPNNRPGINRAEAEKRREARRLERQADRMAGISVEPIINKVIDKAVDKAVDVVAKSPVVPDVTTVNAPVIADVIKDVLAADPKFVNATNSEPVLQSGVAWGAAISALGVLAPMILNLFGIDIAPERVVEVGGALVTIGGVIFTLYRRFTPGLKPMFSKGA